MDEAGELVDTTIVEVPGVAEPEAEYIAQPEPVEPGEAEILTGPPAEPRKYYIDGGEVEIIGHLVYDLDTDGKKLQVVRYTEYSGRAVRSMYPTRDALQSAWADPALCPSDDKFREEFAGTSFPSSLIERARYCLERIEAARHGAHDELQVLGAADVHVEHIIPQKIKTKKAKEEFGDWVTYLGEKAESQHPKYVARIGNLTLFAGALNISASNNPFGMKKQAYKDSGILLTKELASMQHFKFKNVDQRSSVLAAKAVELWPIP